MISSMDKAQSQQTSEVPAAPQERAARHARMLARAAEIQMEVMEATRTEAVDAPQPGVDYCARIAGLTKSLRLTLLLEDKFAGQRDERRTAMVRREANRQQNHSLRVKLAMMAAAHDTRDADEASRRAREVCEGLERPEVAELVETSRAEIAVATLCRRWGYPPKVERWLEVSDKTLEKLGFVRPGDDEPWPEDPLEPGSATSSRRKPPDTG